MTSRENVIRAIEKNKPERVPLLFSPVDVMDGDILFTGYAPPLSFVQDVPYRDEWGFILAPHDNTMGQPTDAPFQDGWDGFDEFIPPDPTDQSRFRYYDEQKENMAATGKYMVANMGISGFNRATFIRGFNGFLEDLYIDPEHADRLLDMVFSFENGIIKEFCERGGVDGFIFFDDWGMQNRMIVSPDIFREKFKHRYQEQFELIHSYGKHVIFHSCGYVYDILADLVEAGADVLNLNQPDIFDIPQMSEEFRGKVCFLCPVDHQTVAINGNKEEIEAYVDKLNRFFSVFDQDGHYNGGFMGLIEEYSSMGMSPENYENIRQTFLKLARGE